ncbi:MAG TPA: hypothetical protein VEL31_28885 [Ktedonobacteraceae bacterium]|nr:hypothetical protein [Ktedonobacteraceae bacterium]
MAGDAKDCSRGPLKSGALRTLLLTATARLTSARFMQSLSALFNNEVDESERSQGIGPPPGEKFVMIIRPG